MRDPEETRNIEVPLHWKPARLYDGTRFDWHVKPARFARDREQLAGPKIYRWVLRSSDGTVECYYIGETAEFNRRLAAYRSGTLRPTSTEHLVREEMRSCEKRGGTVDLEFLDLDAGRFYLNGAPIDNYAIGDRDVRLMMESVATIVARTQKMRLINQLGENVNYSNIVDLLNEIAQKGGPTRATEVLAQCLQQVNSNPPAE